MTLKLAVFPVDHSPGFIIHRTDMALASALHRAFLAKGFDITAEQWGVLSRLWETEGLHQSELAARTGKDRHNMTRILQTLERNGYVKRESDEADKRRLGVYLTTEGLGLRERLTPIVMDLLNQIFSGFTQAEVDLVQSLHLRIIDNVAALTNLEWKSTKSRVSLRR